MVDLEDEVMEGFFRWTRKVFTGVVQGVSGNRRFLERFQDGCEKETNSNKLTELTIETIPMI